MPTMSFRGLLSLHVVAAFVSAAPVICFAAQDVMVGHSDAERSYTRKMPAGNLQTEKAWEGFRIFKRADGSCYRVTHSNLRIESDQDSQRAQFDELIADESCPHAYMLVPKPTAN